jgi:hypothetical protein
MTLRVQDSLRRTDRLKMAMFEKATDQKMPIGQWRAFRSLVADQDLVSRQSCDNLERRGRKKGLRSMSCNRVRKMRGVMVEAGSFSCCLHESRLLTVD